MSPENRGTASIYAVSHLFPIKKRKRQGARIPSFAAPTGHDTFGVLDVEIEVAVGIGPLDLCDDAHEAYRLVAVEFRREGMMRADVGCSGESDPHQTGDE